MTAFDLAAIRQRADAATPGPWARNDLYGDLCGPNGEELFYGADGDGTVWARELEDAIFATHARADIPALLDHVDALTKRVENLEDGRGVRQEMIRTAITRLAAVRDLHHEHDCTRNVDRCFVIVTGACAQEGSCAECRNPFPCPTIQAIDGDQ